MGIYTSLKSKRTQKYTLPKECKSILVVGNGMVGAQFCVEAVRLNLNKNFKISVVGDEPVAAYNRIKLGDYVEHENIEKLTLKPKEWYEENDIELKLGERVELIDRSSRSVVLENGETLAYGILVLATGSRPTIPMVEGIDLPKVSIYRNLEDLQAIIEVLKPARSVAILGGGLLGIEAAHTFQKLDLKTYVIQRANFLMTRQLNHEAAEVLEQRIVESGIEVHTKSQKTVIVDSGEGLRIQINGARQLDVDHLIISAGITPNTEIAKEADIACGIRGGCIVNRNLKTNDDRIFAIGECAQVDGTIFGLAAPGFEMAKHLAEVLAGNTKHRLGSLDTSTRLKMSGVDVSVIGASLEKGTQHVYKFENGYRCITLDKRNRIVGAMGVGEWSEYSELHHAYLTRQKFSKNQIRNFKDKGNGTSLRHFRG